MARNGSRAGILFKIFKKSSLCPLSSKTGKTAHNAAGDGLTQFTSKLRPPYGNLFRKHNEGIDSVVTEGTVRTAVTAK